MRAKDLPEIARLTTSEKILLIEDLWASIVAEESTVAVPDSHAAELDRRLVRHESAPGELLSLEELQTKIKK